jgi:hypothetical protein
MKIVGQVGNLSHICRGENNLATKDVHELQGKRIVRGQEARNTQAGWWEKSAQEHLATLTRIREGAIATKVRILANHDCCPVCRAHEGAFAFDEVPALPLEGCSHPNGCRCMYAPVLDLRGP